jgi:3-keto-5-aminohexanoate cleavage enzyme
MSVYRHSTGRFENPEAVYLNATGTLAYVTTKLAKLAVTPYLVAWNVPMLRLACQFAKIGLVPHKPLVSFALTENGALMGHPGTLGGIEAYLRFLPDDIDFTWTVVLSGGNLLPLIPEIVSRGGHVSIGLGDHPYKELGTPSNADVIREAATLVRSTGQEVATPAEARQSSEVAVRPQRATSRAKP